MLIIDAKNCTKTAPKTFRQLHSFQSKLAIPIYESMATAKLYLDTRKTRGNESQPAPLKIAINHRSSTGFIGMDIQLLPCQWDKSECKIIAHPQMTILNSIAITKLCSVNSIMFELSKTENLRQMTAAQLCKAVKGVLYPEKNLEKKTERDDPNTFLKWFDRFMKRKQGRTYHIYEATRRRLVAWMGEESLAKVKFEDIKVAWLEDFEDFLSKTARANANAIHFRNIRAVVNYAIDNEVTSYYAFRRFKIKSEATRKRNLDVTTIRRIFEYTCLEKWQQKYLDFFKLSFLLIGINVVDLCQLKKSSGERIEYLRAKTHRLYSIKVEPEAQEIIDKYTGTERLVCFAEEYADYRYFYHNLCKGLAAIKVQLGINDLTSYWARHSWATIASFLDIPKDTIAAALGHGSSTVTDIYIDFDQRKVDVANRKVIDWVLYGKIDDKVVVEPGTPEFYGQKRKDKVEEPESPGLPRSSAESQKSEGFKASGLNLDAFRIGILPKMKP